MPCLNSETFEVFSFTVKFKPSFNDWAEVVKWCEDNIGKKRDTWTQTGAEMQVSNAWHFKFKEDAVMFSLRWL